MSLESAARAMLTAGSTINLVPDARITHGYRLQDTALPAITFELQQTSVSTIGSTPLREAEMQISAVAETTLDALAIGAQIRSACTEGTYDGVNFGAVVELGFSVDPPTVGDGDEAEPAVYTLSYRITYAE
jgi:hypothetical protein